MVVAGLTGSIAMGKSTVAAMFAELGAPVFDADSAVRMFYSGKGAEAVNAMFPGVLVEGAVDRDQLAGFVIANPEALKRLESLVHPAVAAAQASFVERAARDGRQLTILDVPLLLETGGESAVDIIVVVSAPGAIQRERALRREGMSEARLETMLLRQMADLEKRRRAHFVIDTSGSLNETRAQVRQFMRAAAGIAGRRGAYA
jgi:dephospho-CoA kinase